MRAIRGILAAFLLLGPGLSNLWSGPTGAAQPDGNGAAVFEVSPKDRSAAEGEAQRGLGKARHGRTRAALDHYLRALKLDPYNQAARDGLVALIGPLGAVTGGLDATAHPAPGGVAGAGSERPDEAVRFPETVPRSGAAPEEADAAGSFLGTIPGAASGPIRTTGPHFRQAEPFLLQVESASRRHGVDPRLILAVIKVESDFNPHARSSSGARGLMQLIPETARRFGARSILDPAQNVDAGTAYLRYLLDLFRGDVDRALAGYNSGEMTVVKYRGVPPLPGVQRFVRDVKGYYRQF
ncbi:MAG TPA: lytic transglycosylase domain-containing protein [Candidatus Polarisedimenticolia bacterium]|nr:lytic transglycosylase domain-containing protein [Candidatus Polarisedimenticolia bacterium]